MGADLVGVSRTPDREVVVLLSSGVTKLTEVAQSWDTAATALVWFKTLLQGLT
jgi:hypothetical protein